MSTIHSAEIAPVYIITKDDAPAPQPTATKDLHPTTWRTGIWLDTKKRAASYPCKPSTKYVYDRAYISCAIFRSTYVEVTDEDTLYAGKRLQEKGLNPLLLNFSDDMYAGGCVDAGSSAQEESLWRRTNLCETQVDDFYPLNKDPAEGIYSPEVSVFKASERDECVDLEKSYTTSFVAIPALQRPITLHKRFRPDDEIILRNKIRLIFQIAHKNGHDSLVLGAWGCGAWMCPPLPVAQLFKEVLREFEGVFKHITFAVLKSPAMFAVHIRQEYATNYEVFSSIFSPAVNSIKVDNSISHLF